MAAITPFLERTVRTEGTGEGGEALPAGEPADLPSIGDLLGGAPPALAEGDFDDKSIVVTAGVGAPPAKDLNEAQPVGALGAVLDVPELAASHAELTRMVWIRRSLEEALLTGGVNGGPREFWVESDKSGELFFHVNPVVEANVVPWYKGVRAPRYSFFGSNGKMACVAAGTRILVQGRGLVEIENVQVGDEVLTRNGWRRVLAARQTGTRETVEVVAESGQRVRVTPDHMLAAKAGWPIGHKPSPSKRGELGWMRADSLEPGSFVLLAPEGYSGLREETNVDHEIGLLIGYVIGDGTFAENGRIAIDVGPTKRDDLDVIADIAQRHFGAVAHWGEYAASRGANPLRIGAGSTTVMRRLYWENEKLTAFFSNLGLRYGSKSPTRRAPKSLFTDLRASALGFLSGLFSTDGSVGFDSEGKVRAEFDTSSRGLAEDVQQIFLMLGARVSISDHRAGMPGKNLQNRVNVRSARAIKVLASAALVNGAKRGVLEQAKSRESGPLRLTRVKAVNDDGLVLPVYDLTIEGADPEFVAGGFVVHNCPTWDLPAGSPAISGSCPGATSGQTVVEPSVRGGQLRKEGGRLMLAVLPPGATEPMELDERKAICQQCVTGDARVLVKGRGLVKIEDLVDAGDFEVWSGVGWRKTRAALNGVKPVVEVRTSWGQTIRCTPDHSLATREDGFVEAGRLEDDQLAYDPPNALAFPLTADIARRLDAADGKRYRTAVDERFPAQWNFDVGLFLGYVLGDGCVSKGEYPRIAIGLGEEDADDLHRLQALVASWCSTAASVKINDGAPGAPLVEKANQRRASISWRVKGLVEFAEDCGLDKSPAPAERRAPSAIWTATNSAVKGFLSGLFSTDGSVLVQPMKVEVTLASVSKGLLQDVQQLLFAFDIKSTICAYTTSNVWRTEQGYNNLYKLSISAYSEVVKFHSRVGFWNRRKNEKLQRAVDALAGLTRVRRTWPHVRAVEVMPGEEPVYDLINVGEEHQFVANGLTVHNCYATGGNYPSPHVQTGEILRYWWSRSMMEDGKVEEWIETMVRAVAALNIPRTRDGIRPIRVHSSGDFFSLKYAAAWLEVANRVWDLEIELGRTHPEIRFWAPTRTWAARGWDWDKLADGLNQPNFIVRASSYHVDDPAPSAVANGWPMGATTVINDHNRGMRPEVARPLTGIFASVEAARAKVRGDQGFDDRFDWTCQTYATHGNADLAPSCHDAEGPDGVRGCRACWNRPELRINYTTH